VLGRQPTITSLWTAPRAEKTWCCTSALDDVHRNSSFVLETISLGNKFLSFVRFNIYFTVQILIFHPI